MKKLYVLFIFCTGLLPVCTADTTTEPIKMVTYFPVLYSSYQTLDVLGRGDIGLLNACELNVDGNVQVAVLNPKKERQMNTFNTGELVVETGSLSLGAEADANGGSPTSIYTSSLEVGDQNGTYSNIGFNQLETTALTAPKKGLIVNGMAYLNSLKIGSNSLPFPACTNGNSRLRWKKLTISGRQAVFLTCGAAS